MNTPHNTNEHRNFRFLVGLGFVLALAGSGLAQNAPERTLIVNGKTVDAGLREIDGHAYIDVETLANLTNGSVVIGPTRVVLKIPAAKAAATTTASAAPAAGEPGGVPATGTKSGAGGGPAFWVPRPSGWGLRGRTRARTARCRNSSGRCRARSTAA